MKIFFILFVIFCTSMGHIKCEATIEELEKSIEICLEKFNITEDDLKSSEVDDTCFNSCVNINVGVIKDKKFDLKRNAEFIHLIKNKDYIKKMIEAYEYCASKMPEFEDECQLTMEIEDCVDMEIGSESSKSEED